MTDTKTTLTWVLKDEVSGPARGIGASLGGLVNPTTLAIGAVAGLTAGLVGAVKAAADEQVGLAKLDAALKANVEGFSGNTDAIEELISKRELLGFADDEQRDSLALLVAATNDVEEAQRLQGLAMDLARLKGVDLATATTAVAKASEGSTRELKALGIAVTDNMTSTEALTALQAAAAGQAEIYGTTLAGKWEALQIKFGDVVEDVGAALLPALTEMADFLLLDLVPAVQDLVDELGPQLSAAFDTAAAGFKVIGDAVGPLVAELDRLSGHATSLLDVLNSIGAALNPMSGLQTLVTPGGGIVPNVPYKAPNLPTSGSRTAPAKSRITRAAGGPVDPYGTYLVGEQGPEWLQMGSQGGSIIPGAGSGVPVELAINIDGDTIARVVDRRLYLDIRASGGAYRPR